MIVIRSKRTRSILRCLIPFVLFPATAMIGFSAFAQKQYLFVTFVAAIWAILLFASGFDNRKSGAYRAVVVAVMAALCVVGRFIPFFKPVTALTIITAMYFGGECGFLVGAMAALVSNFYFGHGPWSAFQMLAWGMIGLIAGFISGWLKKSRILLLVYGALSGILYSLMMDIWTVIWYNGSLNFKLYLTAAVTAAPHTVLYALSNMVFLWLLARPFGEKLERVRIKYQV